MVAGYSTPTDDSFGSRKLAHYNVWLLDPKRPAGVPYPGFPEEIKMEKTRAAYVEDFTARKAAKVVKPKAAAKAKVARNSTVPTKQSMATQIYRDLGGDKPLVIAKIQEQLVMSLAGATTYFYNAKKLA